MAAVMDADAYCREIEAYLCRRNDGHLIRIVGPSFERVSGWASRGIPLKVAFAGIDRHFERYYARGPRRRPVRVDFCEADVLDAFDEWRRAVGLAGVRAAAAGSGAPGAEPEAAGEAEDADRAASKGSLPGHLERVIARLTALRAGGRVPEALSEAIDRAVREIDASRAAARTLRGEARRNLIGRLEAIDAEVASIARAACPAEVLSSFRIEAEETLAPFRARMAADAYARAFDAATTQLAREYFGLPVIAPGW